MITATSVQLSASLQALIDSRLDTIDRMLLGSMARQDRLAIVKEVETQIHEMLQDRGTEEIERDDVLAVLRRLDPPEAYLPEESRGEPIAARGPDRLATAVRKEDPRIARVSGIVGLTALPLILIVAPCLFALTEVLDSEFCLFGSMGIVLVSFVGSIVGLVVGIYARRSGVWAVVGVVTNVIAMFVSFVVGVVFMLQILE